MASKLSWETTSPYLSYTGKTVTISFHMMASPGTAKSGWYIDDIQVFGKVEPGNIVPILFLLNQ